MTKVEFNHNLFHEIHKSRERTETGNFHDSINANNETYRYVGLRNTRNLIRPEILDIYQCTQAWRCWFDIGLRRKIVAQCRPTYIFTIRKVALTYLKFAHTKKPIVKFLFGISNIIRPIISSTMKVTFGGQFWVLQDWSSACRILNGFLSNELLR